MPAEPSPAYSVPSARNAARIILLLSRRDGGMRMSEVARELGLNVSTCHNILRSLCDEGVLALDPASKSYRIGLGLISAVGGVIARGDPIGLIRPILQALGDRHRMTAIFSEVVGRSSLRMLASAVPPGSITLHAQVGMSAPLLAGAMGRVVAALGGLGPETLKARFDETPREREVAYQDFLADIARVRAQGWAVDEGTYQRGIWGIATAVPAPGGRVDQLICLASAAETIPEDRVRTIAEDLMATARRIGENLAPGGAL
jgi:DNA-binding IclR family transcriptional regulator